MKRIVNFFAPDGYAPSKEPAGLKQNFSTQRATCFVARLFQQLAGTYAVLSRISNETEDLLREEERKNRIMQKERKETVFFQQNRVSMLDYEVNVPAHILARQVLNLKP